MLTTHPKGKKIHFYEPQVKQNRKFLEIFENVNFTFSTKFLLLTCYQEVGYNILKLNSL